MAGDTFRHCTLSGPMVYPLRKILDGVAGHPRYQSAIQRGHAGRVQSTMCTAAPSLSPRKIPCGPHSTKQHAAHRNRRDCALGCAHFRNHAGNAHSAAACPTATISHRTGLGRPHRSQRSHRRAARTHGFPCTGFRYKCRHARAGRTRPKRNSRPMPGSWLCSSKPGPRPYTFDLLAVAGERWNPSSAPVHQVRQHGARVLPLHCDRCGESGFRADTGRASHLPLVSVHGGYTCGRCLSCPIPISPAATTCNCSDGHGGQHHAGRHRCNSSQQAAMQGVRTGHWLRSPSDGQWHTGPCRRCQRHPVAGVHLPRRRQHCEHSPDRGQRCDLGRVYTTRRGRPARTTDSAALV